MEISPYVNMGNFGEGRHLYLMLLIDARRYGVRIKEKSGS